MGVGEKEAYVICQSLPQLSIDQRYYAAGIFWCAAVVLARWVGQSTMYRGFYPNLHSLMGID